MGKIITLLLVALLNTFGTAIWIHLYSIGKNTEWYVPYLIVLCAITAVVNYTVSFVWLYKFKLR